MMEKKTGFDTEKYLKAQKTAIEKRLAKFSDRLYLEFGGKLLDDFHAARTLPGYNPNAKLQLLKSLRKNLEVIYCVSVRQLRERKLRGDYGVSYEIAMIKAVGELEQLGLPVSGVVINRFSGEEEALILAKRLKRMKIPVYFRRQIEGYPDNISKILSKEGYGKDDYVKVKKPLVVVWGAGPGSGKMSTCLGQIYQEGLRGLNSGYAKFETFPIWDLSLDHPVNIAYEASTADLGDFNLIDPFHLKAYGQKAVNYNRDIESFPIIKSIFEKVLTKNNFTRQYRSPTDMGFNVISEGIIDDKVVREAAKKECVFYLFRYRQEFLQGLVERDTLMRMDKILDKLKIDEDFLKTVPAARQAQKEALNDEEHGNRMVYCGAAIELPDGKIVTGKNSPLLHAEAACFLNALKILAGIPDDLYLISDSVIERLREIKEKIKGSSFALDCTEAFWALAVSTETNPIARKAEDFISQLKNCFMHTTHQPSPADMNLFRKLGIWVSTDGIVEGTQ